MLEIYGRPNSLNVRKVLWLCEEIGLPYQRSDWGRDHKPTTDPEFMQLSIFGVVPVVVDDGFVLRESNTILRYLCSRHGHIDLYPADLKARAVIEQWMDYANTDMGTGMRPVFQGKVLGMKPHDLPEMVAWGAADWNKQMGRVDAYLQKAGPYLAGPSFTLADIPAGLMIHRWMVLDFDKPKLPALRAYYERLGEREGFRKHGCNGMP